MPQTLRPAARHLHQQPVRPLMLPRSRRHPPASPLPLTRKVLGEVLGVSGQTLGRKVRGEIRWTIEDLFCVTKFFDISVADLLPRRVPLNTTKTPSEEGATKDMVAGVGFEPTTSGL